MSFLRSLHAKPIARKPELKPTMSEASKPFVPVVRAQFVEQYNELIRGREFVEYKEYYGRSTDRFWRSFDKIQRLNLPLQSSVIDIGGGIMAALLSNILGLEACVGDVNERAADDLSTLGMDFRLVDLTSDDRVPAEKFDLVILQEVIEHLPQPPYIVFERILKFMKPGGILFLTTPNGSRIRNILYMLAGKQILDNFRYPGPKEALGHQQEYVLPQLIWQLKRAGMITLSAEQYADGWKGAGLVAQAAHLLVTPGNIFPHLRNGLMITARSPTQRLTLMAD
jgi:SAM-dependent methyltransferase